MTLPLAPGRWLLDPLHCSVEFTARHMAISKVRGRFHQFHATLVVGTTLDDCHLKATVDLASVDTGNADRDAHLRGSDFFDADTHPVMHFASRRITERGNDRYDVVGDLSLNGATSDLHLGVRFHGVESFPGDGSTHAGFEATGALRRSDFGVDFNVPLAAGGVVVSDRIGIELDVQLQPASELREVRA